jgi:hypothetical protein
MLLLTLLVWPGLCDSKLKVLLNMGTRGVKHQGSAWFSATVDRLPAQCMLACGTLSECSNMLKQHRQQLCMQKACIFDSVQQYAVVDAACFV